MQRNPVLLMFLTYLFIGHTVPGTLAQPVITTATLFEDMIDMKKLSVFPDPGYRCIQYSSYDHRSNLPGGPDWFANSDGFGGEPVPNFEKVLREPDADGVGEYLVADVPGPGAVVRLWTARIGGTIKVYLDHDETPVYEGTADDFFMHTYDGYRETRMIDTELLEKTVYQRNASYAPIPFAGNLRVVWIGKLEELHFYQMEVRLYPEQASVRSFSPEDIATHAQTINRVLSVLADPCAMSGLDGERTGINASLTPGSKDRVVLLEGPKAIRQLTLKVSAPDIKKALRQTVLHIRFDGYPWGQVQAPVGDFFGAAPGINPYHSMPFSVEPDGTMTSRFYMPFRDNCRIELENLGEQTVAVTGSVTAVENDWGAGSMHFRARWRVNHNITGSPEAVIDLPFVITRGKGLYVGTTSYVMNPVNIPTSWGNWWGEGDEKIFVDDDPSASLFGTGSEDYYNYAWSSADIFIYPYCGQPRNDGPANRGFVTNYRWHIPDPIPFTSQLGFYMELFPHVRTPGMSYARIGYYYALPGAMDDHIPIMPDDVVLPELPEEWQPVASHASANAVFYQAEDLAGPGAAFTIRSDAVWSDRGLLVWMPRKTGDKMEMKLDVAASGQYRIHLVMAHMPTSGKIRASIKGPVGRGQEEGTGADLYRPYRVLSRNLFLGELELEKGMNMLEIEFTGTNKQVDTPEIGIDFIWLQKVEN